LDPQRFLHFGANIIIDSLVSIFKKFFNAGFDFRRLAFEEIKKYNRSFLVRQAAKLINNIQPNQYKTWGKPGIRAQLLNTKTRTLEMDFILEGDHRSTHVLNAVSPAFTCSIPFAKYLVDFIENHSARIK
jgi:(S)-2-hydroxyglutarate dehydrogenase